MGEDEEMTIDEAIAHSEEVAATAKCKQCAKEHRQLANWLKELKEKRQMIEDIKERIKFEIGGYEDSVDIAYGLQLALDIIDRHIGKGGNNDKC